MILERIQYRIGHELTGDDYADLQVRMLSISYMTSRKYCSHFAFYLTVQLRIERGS